MLLRAQEAGAGMTDTQVRDEAITLFLAGHETTSNALTWTWYLLSRNTRTSAAPGTPSWTRSSATAPPAAADLARLPLTDAVLHEAIRLYPPAWAMGRTALDAHAAGGFDDPGRRHRRRVAVAPAPRRVAGSPIRSSFRPERWPAGPEPRHAYVPFGAGPRMCIGEPFAWMEAALLLATIGRRWELDLSPVARVELQPVVTLRPRHGMPMTPLRPRRAA